MGRRSIYGKNKPGRLPAQVITSRAYFKMPNFNRICNQDYWLIPFWWDRLYQDGAYRNKLADRWEYLRSNQLQTSKVIAYIDSVASVLNAESQQRNFQKWPVLNQYVWPNSYVGGTYANEIGFLKSWITARFDWLDRNINNMQVVTGIEDAEIPDITIYPNPLNGIINIRYHQTTGSGLQVEIVDNLGRLKFQDRIPAQSSESNFDLGTSLNPGMYLLRLMDENQLIHTQKIVVN